MEKRFVGNYVIKANVKLVTGLHIGGVKETIEIGGTDAPVIYGFRKTENGKTEKIPIIPGSSIKGKMRSLLDMKYAKALGKGDVLTIEYPEDGRGRLIKEVFGSPAKKEGFNRTRLIVRDAAPTEETVKFWKTRPELLHGVEIKGENYINRITSMANPRFFERVPAESVFSFEAVLTLYEGDDKKEMLGLLFEGMKMLQDNYLGGHGSRGYGKVRFTDITLVERPAAYYHTGEGEREVFTVEAVSEAENEIKNL